MAKIGHGMHGVRGSAWSALAVTIVAVVSLHARQQPTNDLPNPYRAIANHFQMPAGRTWGATSAVGVDKDGTSIWVGERCGANSCLDSKLDSILKFDASGTLVKSFGGGTMVFPHGMHVDKDGNIWVTDGQDNRPRRARGAPPDAPLPPAPPTIVGHQVFKYSPEGKLLMTLGTPGRSGNPPEALTDPTNVVTDTNGDVYVAESHTNVEDPNLVGRISVFDKSGKFLRTIGKTGTGPGEFRTPHALVFDSKGRLIVADRHNHRIQILTKEGKYLGEYKEFGRVSGMAIDKNDNIYTADSESDAKRHPGWRRGIRVGNLKDGKVTIFVPPNPGPTPDGAMGEGLALDAAGNIYTAEATIKGIAKHVKN